MGDYTSPEDEPRLLPALLDYRAAYYPDLIWGKFPVSPTSYKQGFRTATYSQMRNAVDRVAWLLVERVGPSTTFDTLAYMGPGDLRYHIALLAAVKAGYKPFFPSPRNSSAAQKDLLTRLKTRVLVTTDPEPVFVSSLLREYPIEVIHIPPLEDLLCSEGIAPYPYDKRFNEARNEPLFVLHTSGIPKPLIYSHEFAWRIYQANSLSTSLDKHLLRGEWFSFLPAFHASRTFPLLDTKGTAEANNDVSQMAGIGVGFVIAVYSKNIPVWPLPGRPPSTDTLVEAIKYGTFTWAYLLPVILDGLGKDPDALNFVANNLKFLLYAGGALPESVGKIVSARISTFAALGSSECGPIPSFRISDASGIATWQYLYIHPSTGSEFQHRMDDLHELVFRRSHICPETQPVFDMFPDLDEYETRDLFSSHPTVPNLWRHRGRKDDIVIFLNGEKTNPVSFEEQVSQHPAVRAALVAGNQRFEACLLVEPTAIETLDEMAKAELVETIWPTVEEANSLTPAHARVSKSKILILDPRRPMLRAGKGTIQRAGTVKLYQDDIEALYADTETETSIQPTNGNHRDSLPSKEDTVAGLRSLVKSVTSWPEVEDNADFFALGMDSLQVLRLNAAVRSTLGIAISQGVIYKNPSIDLLTKYLYCNTEADTKGDRIAAMMQLLHNYERQVDQLASKAAGADRTIPPSHVVILTGSTGTLGSFILDQLLINPDISHIYCLNRSQDSKSAQITGNKRRKLPCGFPDGKVTFLAADLTKDGLGLNSETYNTFLNSATQIIHNAWPVNFNQPLQYFEASLDGVLNLTMLAHQGKYTPSVLFISSISAVSSYSTSSGLPTPPSTPTSSTFGIPEEIFTDPTSPAPMGYGESKYLGERILHYASTKLAISTGIARIGQISGTAESPRGWNKVEWLPSLVIGSRCLGALPDSLGGNSLAGEIDWIPVDMLAPVLVGLSAALLKKETSGTRVFHCVNPSRVAWKDLIPTILEELSTFCGHGEPADPGSNGVVTVPLAEWVRRLQDSIAVGGSDVDRNPAAKLVDFYQQMLAEDGHEVRHLSTARTEELSQSLREMPAVRPEWVKGWVREWLSVRIDH
ncbi:putative NRPS-like enzyme [Aspergillus granulosus]|uniref:NRPS-like enzyme n=1 Tax=Aspergillus granulosus TaxID=176169 RepID=A0ABR4HA20_9EURO